MSDVASAFKILISAQPDQALDAFKNLVASTKEVDAAAAAAKKTTKAWGDTWSELNAKIEVVGKVFGAVKDSVIAVGTAMIDAGMATADFISAGGNYHEQRTQFEAVAKSYGESGDKIVETLQDITDNNISLSDAMKLGAKAVAVNLKDENGSFEVAMTFAKKWSEAKGESFTSVAETIVSAFATGKYASLKEMGIIADESTKLGDVMVQMATRLKSGFVDAGNNSADALGSIEQSYENLKLKIGEALNASGLTNALVKAADDFAAAIKEIDYAAITENIDILIGAFEDFATKNGITWVTTKKLITETSVAMAEMAKNGISSIAEGIGSLSEKLAEIEGIAKTVLLLGGSAAAVAIGAQIAQIILSVQALGVAATIASAPFAAAIITVVALTAAVYALAKAYEWSASTEIAELGDKAKGRTVDEILDARKKRLAEQAKAAVAEDASEVQVWNETKNAWENVAQKSVAKAETEKTYDLVALQAMTNHKDDKKAASEAKKDAADAVRDQKEANAEAVKNAKEAINEQAKNQLRTIQTTEAAETKNAKAMGKSGSKFMEAIKERAKMATRNLSDWKEAALKEAENAQGFAGSSTSVSSRGTAFQKSLAGGKYQQDMVNVTREQSTKIDDLSWYLSKVADALAQPVRVQPENTTGAIEQLIFEVIRQATIISREEGVKVLSA